MKKCMGKELGEKLPPLDESPGGKLKLNYKEKELSPGQISFLDLDML